MEKENFMSEVKEFAKSIITKYFPTKEKFTDAKLADGTIITYDAEELAVGVVAYLVDTTGAKLPMPKQSYVLEDGTTFDVVDDMGTADNVVPAPEAPEAPETTATPTMPEAQAAAPVAPRTSPTGEPIPSSVIETRTKETKFESEEEKQLNEEIMTEKFSKIEKENADMLNALTELKAKADNQEALIKDMFKLIEMIGNVPAVAPTETKKNVFKAADVKAEVNAFKEDLKRLQAENKNI